MLGGDWAPRILEPSPGGEVGPPWFADDPVAGRPGETGTPVLPYAVGHPPEDRTWSAVCAERPELAAWCAERWLAAWDPPPALPPGAERTRASLHLLAERVLSPWRRARTERVGLRWVLGGVGTPFTRDDAQARVVGDLLELQHGPHAERWALTTLGAAAAALGIEIDADADRPLEVDPAAARAYAAWFGFGTSVLEELRHTLPQDAAVGRVQLWPGHFDVALEAGAEPRRAAYGASPGDDAHPEPYLYVAPWAPPQDDGFWDDPHFFGRATTLGALRATPDPRAAALAFLREAWERLRVS